MAAIARTATSSAQGVPLDRLSETSVTSSDGEGSAAALDDGSGTPLVDAGAEESAGPGADVAELDSPGSGASALPDSAGALGSEAPAPPDAAGGSDSPRAVLSGDGRSPGPAPEAAGVAATPPGEAIGGVADGRGVGWGVGFGVAVAFGLGLGVAGCTTEPHSRAG